MRNQRRRIWIDPFQTRLVIRQVFYCLSFFAAAWVVLSILRGIGEGMGAIAEEPGNTRLGLPALLTILSVLAMIAYDSIRYVHRVVGPVYRFRKTIQAVAAGEPVDLVRLRQGDYFQEVMDDVNDMLIALERQGAVTIKANHLSESTAKAVCQAP
jgi:hypothetical protein